MVELAGVKLSEVHIVPHWVQQPTGRSLKAFSRRPLLDAFPGGLQHKAKFIQFSVHICYMAFYL